MLNNKRNLVKLFLDIFSVVIASFLAIGIRFEGAWRENMEQEYFLVYLLIYLIAYFYRKTIIKSWTYTNSMDVLSLIVINLISFLGTVTYFSFMREEFSRSVTFLFLILTVIFQLTMRFIFRLNKMYRINSARGRDKKTALIYGAGDAGVGLVNESKRNSVFPYRLLGIIDDNPRKKGNMFNGIKVLGNFEDMEDILDSLDSIDAVIIAIPSIEKKEVNEIVHKIRSMRRDVEIKILPSMDELLHGEGMLSQIRDVSIDDLLGREQVLVNGDSIRELIQNKTVFVTGGAGSIGSELARQIAKHNPKKLIGIDVNENDLYFLELELGRLHRNLDFQSEICNIRERDKVEFLFHKHRPEIIFHAAAHKQFLFHKHRPEIIFHAAAHKHVPLMEYNPEEAIKNNIFGTKNVTEMAEKYGAERFVLISTDKAVNPTNIMGATKRGCELVVEEANKRKNSTKFMAVRFGNVLGSNGSVIPLFRELIAQGKNLTITHSDITRYFMTIPEAAQLVIEAGSLGDGGEVFILDMGEPVKIADLAKKMIELSGADVGIDIVGLRPGEKLYEELLYDVNSAEKTANQKIFITRLKEEEIDIQPYLEELSEAVKNPDTVELKEIMKRFIVSYEEPEHHKKVGC